MKMEDFVLNLYKNYIKKSVIFQKPMEITM